MVAELAWQTNDFLTDLHRGLWLNLCFDRPHIPIRQVFGFAHRLGLVGRPGVSPLFDGTTGVTIYLTHRRFWRILLLYWKA
jgi:hypothetical protein